MTRNRDSSGAPTVDPAHFCLFISAMNATDPFAAIADQNGRILLEALRRGPKTVSQLPARPGAGSLAAIVQEHIRRAGFEAGTRAA